MRVLSWNLFGLSDERLDERTEAAMFLSLLGGPPAEVLLRADRPPPPEVLMFQEVTDRTLRAHLRPHLTAAGYTLFPSDPPLRSYFEVLATAPSLQVTDARIHELDSGMARELVEVHATRDGVPWRLFTAHLESMASGARLRMAQARDVLTRLRAVDSPAVFGGDTNLRVAEADELGFLPDAWEASGSPAAERWTRVRSTGRTSRYDRFWGHRVKFRGFRCIGRDPVAPGGPPPSDHLGIVTDVRAVP